MCALTQHCCLAQNKPPKPPTTHPSCRNARPVWIRGLLPTGYPFRGLFSANATLLRHPQGGQPSTNWSGQGGGLRSLLLAGKVQGPLQGDQPSSHLEPWPVPTPVSSCLPRGALLCPAGWERRLEGGRAQAGQVGRRAGVLQAAACQMMIPSSRRRHQRKAFFTAALHTFPTPALLPPAAPAPASRERQTHPRGASLQWARPAGTLRVCLGGHCS